MPAITRRKFIGGAAAATVTAATMSSPFIKVLRASEPGANDKVRLGLIGCGGMGQGDLKCFFLNPEVDCAVICDIDDAHLLAGTQICEEKGYKKPDIVKDFRRVLDRKDVDVVLIATPDHWHALPMVMAAQAGKDIYVEKPLAKTINEGRAMLEAGTRAAVGRLDLAHVATGDVVTRGLAIGDHHDAVLVAHRDHGRGVRRLGALPHPRL